MGRSLVPDISSLPTRIEEIPKEILRMYGIVVDDEPCYDSDASDDGVLVVDEGPQVKLHVDLTKFPISSPEPLQKPPKEDVQDSNKRLRLLLENQVNHCGVCKEDVPNESWHDHQQMCKITYCNMCKKLVLDNKDHVRHHYPTLADENKKRRIELTCNRPLNIPVQKAECEVCKKTISEIPITEHMKLHCSQPGCLDLLLDDVDRIRHSKMHDHPTKPFACRWCKKRYRFSGYVEKHQTACRSVRKAKESWKNAGPSRVKKREI